MRASPKVALSISIFAFGVSLGYGLSKALDRLATNGAESTHAEVRVTDYSYLPASPAVMAYAGTSVGPLAQLRPLGEGGPTAAESMLSAANLSMAGIDSARCSFPIGTVPLSTLYANSLSTLGATLSVTINGTAATPRIDAWSEPYELAALKHFDLPMGRSHGSVEYREGQWWITTMYDGSVERDVLMATKTNDHAIEFAANSVVDCAVLVWTAAKSSMESTAGPVIKSMLFSPDSARAQDRRLNELKELLYAPINPSISEQESK